MIDLNELYQSVKPDPRAEAFISGKYIATIEVSKGEFVVIQQPTEPRLLPAFMRPNPVVLYPPLCDEPGTYSTKQQAKARGEG